MQFLIPVILLLGYSRPPVGGTSYAAFWRKADLLFSVFDNYDRPFDILCFALFLALLVWLGITRRLWLAPRLAWAVGIVFAAVMFLRTDWPALFVTPVFAIAVWTFAAESGALSRALRRGFPQRLGAWSYSIYMVHPVVTAVIMVGTSKALPHTSAGAIDASAAVGVALSIGYLVAVVAIASITYRQIELRGQRLFNQWAKRERTA